MSDRSEQAAGRPGRAALRRRHRRGPGARDRTRTPYSPTPGLRRRRRDGRSRRRRDRQPDRRGGVRPAGRRRVRPSPGRRCGDARRCGQPSVASLEYGATHRGRDGGAWHGGTTAVVALLVEGDDGPLWLLANLGDSRIYAVRARRAAPGEHRPQRRAGAGRPRADHRGAGSGTSRSGTSSPARWADPTRSTPTSSWCRWPRRSGCCCAPTGSPTWSATPSSPGSSREHADPARRRRRRVVGGRPGRRRHRQRDGGRRRCGGIGRRPELMTPRRQRESLHEKLGALP